MNSTSDHATLRKDTSAWDIYVSALVTAPTGDPEYFFTTACLDSSAANYGKNHDDQLESLYTQLHSTFDSAKRAELATQMQQVILNNHTYVFASFLQMGIVSRSNVSGMIAHPCDYYEITVDLNVE